MPILLPTAVSVGISPLFFVVFMVIALSFGLITPPVGVCLYAACNVSGMSIEKITKGLVPWLIVLVLCLLFFICQKFCLQPLIFLGIFSSRSRPCQWKCADFTSFQLD